MKRITLLLALAALVFATISLADGKLKNPPPDVRKDGPPTLVVPRAENLDNALAVRDRYIEVSGNYRDFSVTLRGFEPSDLQWTDFHSIHRDNYQPSWASTKFYLVGAHGTDWQKPRTWIPANYDPRTRTITARVVSDKMKIGYCRLQFAAYDGHYVGWFKIPDNGASMFADWADVENPCFGIEATETSVGPARVPHSKAAAEALP